MGLKKLQSLLFVLLSILTTPCWSQIGWDSLTIHSNNKFFYGLTYNVLPDIEKSPIKVYPNYVSYNSPYPPFLVQGDAVVFAFNTNFISLGGKFRYNVIEFNPGMSLSLSFIPSLGAGFTVIDEPDVGKVTPYANCSYNLPLLLEFNYGNGATNNSFSEYGIFAFTGVENTGLFFKNNTTNGDIMDVNGNFYTPAFISEWTEAVFGLGVRYFNRKHVKKEIFLKYGVGPSEEYISPAEQVTSVHPWTLKLTFVRDF